jgi:hypothetical protein
MAVDDILFEPLTPLTPVHPVVHLNDVIRLPESLSVQVRGSGPKNLYLDLASEVIDHAVAEMPSLTDVRPANAFKPRGVLDLAQVVDRFYEGTEEIWVSRPKHMPATQQRFTGRFGYIRACKLPTNQNKLGYITWYWVNTDEGHLPAIDMGLMVYHPQDKWWRVFSNKSDAADYYTS